MASVEQAVFVFQNATGQTFSSATLGSVSTMSGFYGFGMSLQQQIGLVPAGTVRIAVTLTLGNVDSFADSLSLVLNPLGTAPGFRGGNKFGGERRRGSWPWRSK